MARRKKPNAKKPKNDKTAADNPEEMLNLPTYERLRMGGIVIRNNRAFSEDPLRIDKMFKNAVIDEMQHLYGVQIITLWNIASRPFLKSMRYEQKSQGGMPDFTMINLSRMDAEDQFHKVMGFLRPREYELIRRICFEEQGALEAGRAMGLPVNGITVYVRAAFDALGDALAKMRDIKRALEKPPQEERQPLVD